MGCKSISGVEPVITSGNIQIGEENAGRSKIWWGVWGWG